MREAEHVGGGESDLLDGDVGRRERKKAQTRQALIDASWELFEERGYAATTIEHITERVDVSSRTFFRYFPSKEAVVFADTEDKSALIVDALAERPAGEPVLESIRAALHALAADLAQDPGRATLVGQLCRENPGLDEYRQQAGGQHAEDALLEFLEDRLDDPMAPTVIASALRGAMSAAWDYWLQSGQQIDMSQLLDQAIDALETGFSS